MTKVLITGANGYIGSHVVDVALSEGTDITALAFSNTNINKNVNFISDYIFQNNKPKELYQKLGSPDVIIHLAWRDIFNHNSDYHLRNLNNHYNFLHEMIDSGCQNISVMGTQHEIGFYEGEVDDSTPCNPSNMYGIAKNALRQAFLSYANGKIVSAKWLRGFYIVGDKTRGKSIFSKIYQMEAEGKTTFPFTSGMNQYDFINVVELAEQIVKSSLQTKVSGIIHTCSGKPVALKDKVNEFIRENNFKIRPAYGMFPDRPYDSKIIYGNTDKINMIMESNRILK
jgi:dTDP-6-deoxy-L-talose 4-dehydrogenase (NAD+)